jgi:hypothetical protein
VSGLADGATCDPTGAANVCALPDICVTSGGTSTCRAVGYTEQSIPAASFVDACASGQHFVRSVPDGMVPVAPFPSAIVPPFSFSFWGSDITKLWPNVSGAISFSGFKLSDYPGGVGNGYLPTDAYGPVAAPFWDALYLRDLPVSDVCYATVGTAPNRQLVIEWDHVGRLGRVGVTLDFEVVLHETSNVIDFVYGALAPTTGPDAPWADGQRAAIGLQSGQDGVAIVHTGAAPAGGALRYTPK